MPRPRDQAGLTIPEILVIILIVGVLAALAIPASPGGLTKGTMTQALSNMKQLHLATQQMAKDGTTTGDTNIGWPGDRGGSFALWARALVDGGYLTTDDLCKLLSAPGKITPGGQVPLYNANAIIAYAVKQKSPGDTVFLTTANFTNTPTGGLPPLPEAKPFGMKGFVIFHRAGDGAIFQPRQAGMTNLIGGYVPLCR